MKTIFGAITGLLLVSSCPLLADGWSQSPSPTYITKCGYVITAPGEYHLASDLSCPTPAGATASGLSYAASYAITVNASFVNLYFDGHTLSGKPSGTQTAGTIGVLVSASSNVTINGNGTITGFEGGIVITNSTQVTVCSMTATAAPNGPSGLGAGLIVENSSCNKIIQCNFNKNAIIGLSLLGHGVMNTSTGCMNTGYSTWCMTQTEPQHMLPRLCSKTAYTGNSGASDNNQVTNSIFDSNGTTNVGGAGVTLVGAHYNYLCDNKADSNLLYGFDIYSGSNYNTFTSNEASGNGKLDALDQNSGWWPSNWYLGNWFGTQQGIYF